MQVSETSVAKQNGEQPVAMANDEGELGEGALSPNVDFYLSAGDSERIMNPTYFSAEVVQFIHDERVFLTKLLLQEQYDCIVEIGCHAGHNSAWLSDLCNHYIGVDINAGAIERAQRRPVRGDRKAEFFCTPAERVVQLLHRDETCPRRKIVLFPFNLFGNFINIERLLQTLDMNGLDLMLSNFNTKSATTIGRYKYYANCFGEAPVRVYDAEQGILFKAGQDFQSIAFHPSYLSQVVREISRYHGISMPFSMYGDLFMLTK